MFAAAIVLTVLLLLETLPSAGAGLLRAKAGVTRLDKLTRLGLLDRRNLWVVPLLGVLHLAGSALVIAGLATPVAGVIGAALEAVIFGWVLARQVRFGDRGGALGSYTLFATMALAVLAVNALR